MGTQIVQPTGYARTLVVARIAERLQGAIGDWAKYGEGAEGLVADALVLLLGRPVLRSINQHLQESDTK